LISQFLIKNLALTDFTHSPLNGFLLVFMVNRLQIGFILLLIPTQLISGDKYWLIILAFLISQFNLYLISRWINNRHSANPVQLKTLLPKQILYPLVFLGIGILFVKFSVSLIGYTKIVQIYLLTEESLSLLLTALIIVIAYSMAKGVNNLIRFSLLTFIFSAWIAVAYVQFFFSPLVSVREFFPLIGEINPTKDIYSLLYLISFFSGPELLLFLKKWVKTDIQTYRYLTIGNLLSLFELSLLFILAVLFYGPEYLKKIEYPLVMMARYVQTPFIDRLEMFIIPFFMFPLIFSLSLVNLFIFKGTQYLLKFKENALSFYAFIIFIGLFILFIQNRYWVESIQENTWITYFIYTSAFSYMILPIGFYIIKKVKKI
jgi:hypothetical protein